MCDCGAHINSSYYKHKYSIFCLTRESLKFFKVVILKVSHSLFIYSRSTVTVVNLLTVSEQLRCITTAMSSSNSFFDMYVAYLFSNFYFTSISRWYHFILFFLSLSLWKYENNKNFCIKLRNFRISGNLNVKRYWCWCVVRNY